MLALNKIIDGKKYKSNNWECKIDSIYFGEDETNIIPLSSDNQNK